MALRTIALICLLVCSASADLVLQGGKTPVTTPVVAPTTKPVVAPVVTTPAVTPAVTTPVITPITKPVVAPTTRPVVTPVVTTPVVAPATKPVVAPATRPVVAPTTTTPVVAPTIKPVPAAKPVACPLPLTACDLYYGGRTTMRASIKASTMNQIITNRPVLTKAGLPVITLSTYGCTVVGMPLAPCSGFGFFGATNDAQAQSVLGMFPVQADVAQTLSGKCIKLNVNNFQVNGTWVNVGDGNPTYPEARRCILIQT